MLFGAIERPRALEVLAAAPDPRARAEATICHARGMLDIFGSRLDRLKVFCRMLTRGANEIVSKEMESL